MTVVLADEGVRERIRTSLDENLCVEAGAGTGKTTVLVARVVETLRLGKANADQLVVITFTEAAAAELAARVRQDLETARENAESEKRERLDAALSSLHRAHIETIHAFAASLLRERPVEARLDPSFEVLDALQAELRFDAAYDEWLRELLDDSHPEIVLALNRGFDLKQIRQLVEVVHDHRSVLPLAPVTSAAVDIRAEVRKLGPLIDELRALHPLAANDVNGLAQIERILRFDDRLTDAGDDAAWLERVVIFQMPKIARGAGAQANFDDVEDCKRMKWLFGELCDRLEELRQALFTQALVGVLPLAEQFVTRYADKRREEGIAEYDDLLLWAHELLASSREAREYFRGRFRAIFIDEFQDTDPVQAEIALCLASDDEPGDDWLAMPLRPGALTVVGDPKQSIYRFRRADIAVYDAIRRGPLRDGECKLVQNFRSTDAVLDWVNQVFDRVLVEEEGVQPANVALVPTASAPEHARAVTVVHVEPGGKANETRRREGAAIAATLREMVDEGWPVRDPLTRELRPPQYADVAILVQARTQIDLLEEALTRADVPFRNEGSRSFFLRQEVRDLALILMAIDDPGDKISLVGALRSFAFGCSDEDIYLWTVSGGTLNYRAPLNGGPEQVRGALAVLLDLHRLRTRVSLSQLVREVLSRTRLVELALAGWDGEQAAANLIKLADQARAFSSGSAGGLRAFTRWLGERQDTTETTEAGRAEETDDVARIMTMHGAKGLEFPVVVLANIFSGTTSQAEPVPDRRAHRLEVRIGSSPRHYKSPGFDAAWEDEKHRQAAERERLLYVAATRARDRLIVPMTWAPEKKVAAGALLGSLLPSLPTWDAARADQEVNGVFVIDRDKLTEFEEREPERRAPIAEATIERAIAERAGWEEDRARAVREARAELELSRASGADADGTARLLGADEALIVGEGPPLEIGDALHRVMEQIDLRNPANLRELVDATCLVAGIDDRADEVFELAEACLASDAVKRILDAPALYREVPYTIATAEGFAVGRVDVAVESDGGILVVDWKTDSVGPSEVQAAAEHHRPQAQAYARALEAATGRPVHEVVFVFPRARGEAVLTV